MLPTLSPGRTYTWEGLAQEFGFKPNYLSAAGGMPVSSAENAQLVITHPRGGKSFDYQDYWDGPDLIYTGRGKRGDQELTGPNRDVSENRRVIYAFEAAGPRRLLYLGRPTCVETRTGRAPDDDGQQRTVPQFRLSFPARQGRAHASGGQDAPFSTDPGRVGQTERRSRPFDPERRPVAPRTVTSRMEPEELQALHEKAVTGHWQILRELGALLTVAGWSAAEEIPAAIDLWASDGEGRVIFEAKTISGRNELHQTRSAVAQLLEYRLEHGDPDDDLSLVTNSDISLRRARLLDELGIAVLVIRSSGLRAANDHGSSLASRLEIR